MASWRSPAHRRAWRTYIETSLRLETYLDDDLRAAAGLSLFDYHLLLLLSEAPGRELRMGELAERMVFSPSRLNYQVTSMERRGWVLRRRCAEDRRISYAVLTAAGLDVLRAAGAHHVGTVQALVTDDLDDDELRVLTRVFERVQQRVIGAGAAQTSAKH